MTSLGDSVRSQSAGFALLDTLIALLLVATVSSGVAWLLLWSLTGAWGAGANTTATVAARQKLEQLMALEWSFGSDGVPMSDATTDTAAETPRGGGQGLAASPPATPGARVAGYVDFLDRDGRWRGSGTTIPAGISFERRWSVAPLPGDPDTLVLTVVVRHVAVAASAPGAGVQPRPITLQTLRTRTMR